MQRYNYSHSDYMTIKSGSADVVLMSYDDARYMHHADMLRYRMDELEAAGMLDVGLEMQALTALQRARYTQGFAMVWFYIDLMNAKIDQLPA